MRELQRPSVSVVPRVPGSNEQDRVEAAVRYLNERTAAAGIGLAREVGEYVLGVFFDGDFERFSDTRRNKPLSFRRLLERQDLLLPPTTIYTFVRVARQLGELPAEAAERLSLSHHRALLTVKDPQQKTVLAGLALAEGWSKVDLERQVRAQQPKSTRGRKPLPACVKATTRITRALDEAFAAAASPDDLRGMGEARLRETLSHIEQSVIRLQWLQATVEQALDR
jgi:hypothetical protein